MEAVIVLPFFLVVLISSMYVRDRTLARHSAESQARSCVFRYVTDGCTTVPEGCEGVLTTGELEGPGVRDRLIGSLDDISAVPLGDAVFHVVSKVILGAISELGRYADANTKTVIERPPLYGGGAIAALGRHRLACNLVPREAPNVVKDAANFFSPF